MINKTIPVILCAEEDVEGSHGATLGELDEETLFYFASRGIGKETAEDMMTRGKLEMFNRYIGDAATQKLAEQQLEKGAGETMSENSCNREWSHWTINMWCIRTVNSHNREWR